MVMRAKTINEVQNFERGIPPKAALEVGGIALGKELWGRKLQYREDWTNYIIKTFHHKTVYGRFGKFAFDKKHGIPKFDAWGKYKFYVEEIKISDGAEREGLPVEITFIDKDRSFYIVPIDDQNIYIIDDEG